MPTPSPSITTFTDGTVPHAADLNSLGSNLTNLYTYTMGGFRTRKPQVEVRLTNTAFAVATATDTQVNFDTADINTDNMWLSTNAGQFTINTAGTYFLYFQTVHTSGFSVFAARLLVNGTTPSSNGVGTYSAQANGGNVSALIPLAAGATVYGFVYQQTGASVNLSTLFGGTRMCAYWVSP